MGVYYEIKEHLSISRASAENIIARDARGIICGNLAALAGLMVLGEGRLHGLHLTADGRTFDIEKDEITPGYKEVISALEQADEIDLTVDYGYNWRAHGGMYDIVGPFNMMSYLEKPDGDDMTGFFYSAWNKADCEDGNGILVAYGEHNGKAYHGTVEYAVVSEVPAGTWDAQDTVLWLEPENYDALAHPEVIAACKALQEVSDDSSLEVDDKGFLFSINTITLCSPEQGSRFIELVSRLSELMQDDFYGIMGNFADSSGRDARLMIIDEADEGYVVKVAQV